MPTRVTFPTSLPSPISRPPGLELRTDGGHSRVFSGILKGTSLHSESRRDRHTRRDSLMETATTHWSKLPRTDVLEASAEGLPNGEGRPRWMSEPSAQHGLLSVQSV